MCMYLPSYFAHADQRRGGASRNYASDAGWRSPRFLHILNRAPLWGNMNKIISGIKGRGIMYSVKLADGTELTNLELNGNNFIAEVLDKNVSREI